MIINIINITCIKPFTYFFIKYYVNVALYFQRVIIHFVREKYSISDILLYLIILYILFQYLRNIFNNTQCSFFQSAQICLIDNTCIFIIINIILL